MPVSDMMCRCGCETKAQWLVSGQEIDVRKPGRKGKWFSQEPVCRSAKEYLIASALDNGLDIHIEPVQETL